MIVPTLLVVTLLVTTFVTCLAYRRAARDAIEGCAAETRIYRAEAGIAIAECGRLTRSHQEATATLTKQHQQTIERAVSKAKTEAGEAPIRESLKTIINELTRVCWDKRDEDQTYLFSIAVSGRMLGLGMGQRPFERDDLIYIARQAGDMLAHEIITSKFARPPMIAPRNNENRYLVPRASLHPRRFLDDPYA